MPGSYCALVNCHHQVTRDPCQFFRVLRKNKTQTSAWTRAINRINPDGSNWVPTKKSVICNCHFVGGKFSKYSSNPAFSPTILPETLPSPTEFKIETNGIEIKLDENEVIKDRFGQVVDKMIKCASCDKVYVGKCAAKSLRVHYKNVHGGPNMKEAKNKVTTEHLENDDNNYDGDIEKCELCDKVYVGPNALDSMKYHMKSHSGIHHKQNESTSNVVEVLNEMSETNRLKQLNSILIQQLQNYKYENNTLKLENESLKISNEELRDKNEKLVAEGSDGMKIKSSEKLNKCESCGKSFSVISSLKKHIRQVHHRMKNHKCKNCDKSFQDLGQLNRHYNCVHEGQKSNKCEYCGKYFGQKSNLRTHIKRRHIDHHS